MSKLETPSSALQSLIDEYKTNPFSLSKSINLSYQTVLNILKGRGKITVPTALRLGRYFGQSPILWINLQIASEIDKLAKNKKFVSMINSIPRAQKPEAKARTTQARGKTKTLSEKRKQAAKIPGARVKRKKRK